MTKPNSKPFLGLDFIGLDTSYPTANAANAEAKRRVHLDGAASPLCASLYMETLNEFLPHYSNTHSYVHSSAKIASKALAWAHKTVLTCLGADEKDYTSVFTGAGCTAAINRIARGLAAARPDKKVVLVSAMEHHANDLPHRQFGNQVEYIPLTGTGAEQGGIDLVALENLLIKYAGAVNYLAISAVSNVTGIITPIKEACALAHQYGALVLVDGAQSVAHRGSFISDKKQECEPDFFVFSGHKIYCPTSPGVLVAKVSCLEHLAEQDLGGGSVADVSYFDYELLPSYPDREQSGTPNIAGAIGLAAVLQALGAIGFDNIEQHDQQLINYLLTEINKNPLVHVYGDPSAERIGAISINHRDIDHGLFAAILNDYYAIAVRNECFCAHPYVSSMLKQSLWEIDLSGIDEQDQQAHVNAKRGMVRISISAYNTKKDIDELLRSIALIEEKIEEYRPHYSLQADGSYTHNSFKLDWRAELNWQIKL